MVRVISVHHFKRQDVSTCDSASAAVVTPNARLVLANPNQWLQVRNLEENASKISHSFQTIDQISRVYHCPVGNYLATLEGSPGQRDASIRVYTNWDDPKLDQAPVRPRIAGTVTPSVDGDAAVSVDMIEFPLRDAPVAVAVCSSTGNVIVAAANLMVVYKFVTKVHENTKMKYIDFCECIHVFHNFIPKEIALCEDIIGCLSSTEVHIFKVKFSDSDDSDSKAFQSSMSVYSFTSDSEGAEAFNSSHFSSPDSEESHQMDDSGRNVTMRRQIDSETMETKMEGYFGNVKKHPNHVTLSDLERQPPSIYIPEIDEANRQYASMVNAPKLLEQSMGPFSPPADRITTVKYVHPSCNLEADCVTLIYSKLSSCADSQESLKNLRLRPVYWREFRVRRKSQLQSLKKVPDQQHPLQSPFHVHLMSLSAIFTSNNEGYLYHLPGHIRKPGKGCGVQHIATYPFTSQVFEVNLEPSLMHALSQTGLETYTLRSGYHTVMEAENLHRKKNACPDNAENPICLIGLRPFIGAKRLLLSDTHLVVLSQSNDSNTATSSDQWTIYSLKLPESTDVKGDMMQLANMNKTISPQGYFQLLSEAHMVMRTAVRQLSWKMATACENRQAIEKRLENVRKDYYETCWLLGLYYIERKNPSEYRLALPLFRMSLKPPLEVIKHCQGLDRDCGQQGDNNEEKQRIVILPGLRYYIKEIVLNPMSHEDILDAELMDEIIDLLGKHSIETLASLILESTTFKSFKTAKMLEFFRKDLEQEKRSSPAKILAYSVLALEQSIQMDRIEEVILNSPTPVIALSELLIKHHNLLLSEDDSSDPSIPRTFSDLALLLQQCMPQLFVEVLVSVIKCGYYTLDEILQLFVGAFVSMSSGCDATSNTAMMQLFLETFFTDLIEAESDSSSRQSTPTEEEKKLFKLSETQEDALQTLVRSYLTGLSVPIRFGEKDVEPDLFGNRLNFLDRLPPFQNSVKEILDSDSPEFWCQNTLLKLQSILSSPVLATEGCKSTVLKYLEMYPDKSVGETSLRILCSKQSEALSIISKDHPDLLLVYSKDNSLSDDMWALVLHQLHEHLSSDESHPMHEAWYSAMQEVLEYLAQTMDIDTFLKILPNQDGNEELQGYIQMCRKNQLAKDIQDVIVKTGYSLLQSNN